MWVDDQGICHTVALPDPATLMSDLFRKSLEDLKTRNRDDLNEVIEGEQMRFFEKRARLPLRDSTEAEFTVAAPPAALLSAPVKTVDELRQLLQEIDERWRLDALLALEDYLQ